MPDDADKKGVAPGLDSVLDASPDGNAFVWALGIATDDNGPGASDPAEVMNLSRGSVALSDDDSYRQSIDTYTSAFGTTIAFPAGNDGPSRNVNDGCSAYNSLCMGAYRVGSSGLDRTDDFIADFSSRGPTPAGRKKPDLVGIGVTEYAERRWWLNDRGLWDGGMQGTSFASPQGAGAAALLAGSGISDPNAQKAILINSAYQGRATPNDAMGTQTGWQPDWGWGALDLDAAVQQRLNFATGEVKGGGVRFFRASGVADQDRATLVWYRRAITACHTGRCPAEPLTLTNLDLRQASLATQTTQATSTSAIDNVEQVRSPGAAGDVIYAVKANSAVDAIAAEPFALAARRPLTPLQTPKPAVTVDVDTAAQPRGSTATVTATVRNPSADLTAENASLTLEVPAGVEIVDGAATRTLGTLPTTSTPTTHTWTVRGTADGLKRITAEATATRYGETMTGTAADTYTVDGTGPVATIATPSGATTNTALDIAWGATDELSQIASYDIDVATDGGAFQPWLAGTPTTAATYTATRGHSYRFRVRATDSLGNAGATAESAAITVTNPTAPPSTPPTNTPPPTAPTKLSPKLALKKVKRKGSKLIVTARAERAARGAVSGTFTVKVGRKTFRVRAKDKVRTGLIELEFKLPAKVKRAKKGSLTLSYAGNGAYAAQTLKRTVTTR